MGQVLDITSYPSRLLLQLFPSCSVPRGLMCMDHISGILSHAVVSDRRPEEGENEVKLIISLALSHEIKLSGLNTPVKLTERILTISLFSL